MYWIKQVKESGTSGFSMLIFAYSHICIIAHICTRLYICVLARTYVYLIAHICTFSNICVLNCTYVYSKVWLFVHILLVLKLYIITGNLLGKLLFLGIPKYLVKNKCILLRFAKKQFCTEL